jgi:hypothetical protein
MALAFTATKGKAVKNSHESYVYKDGENTVRLVGGILPRYVYWLKGSNNKDIPVECLAFDREKEKFTNAEVDHVPAYFPDKKCSWSYSVNALVDNKVVVLNLKKKLFEQICSAAEDLGDPTDYTTGWDVVFKRSKTGPLPFNVEYTLSVLRCKKRALSKDEVATVEAAIPIDAKFIRATPEEVKTTLERITSGAEEESEGVDSEAVSDLTQ